MGKEKETDINEENISSNRGIDRLCLAVRIPGYGRGNTLFVGWDKSGVPLTTTDQSTLSEQARISYGITKAVTFPYGREYADLPLVPVEFIGGSKPFDRKDIGGDGITQDILTYWVTKGSGGTEQIKLRELDALAAILEGQVIWEDFNEKTMFAGKKIPGQNMYTLFFPAKDQDDREVMYLMMFRPPMKNESNESMYRQFLKDTLQTLANLDLDQSPEMRKGYLQAIGVDEDVVTEAEGGLLAVGVLDILRTKFPDLYILSDARMNQIRRDSEGKSIVTQIKIILREFGLYDLPSSPRTPADLDSYPVNALLAVVGASYKLASRKINS
jgi:hypothetical protein